MTQEERDKAMCYIGRSSCGCVVAVAVDEPKYQKDNAKEIGNWIRNGLTVERMSVVEARKTFGCPHRAKKPKDKQTQLFTEQEATT